MPWWLWILIVVIVFATFDAAILEPRRLNERCWCCRREHNGYCQALEKKVNWYLRLFYKCRMYRYKDVPYKVERCE